MKRESTFKGLVIYQPIAMYGIYLDLTSNNLLNIMKCTENIEHNGQFMTNDYQRYDINISTRYINGIIILLNPHPFQIYTKNIYR